MILTHGMRSALRRVGEDPAKWEGKPEHEILKKIRSATADERNSRHLKARKRLIEEKGYRADQTILLLVGGKEREREILGIDHNYNLIVEGVKNTVSPTRVLKIVQEPPS